MPPPGMAGAVDRRRVVFMLVSFRARSRRNRYDLHMNTLRSNAFRGNSHFMDQFLLALERFTGPNDSALCFLRFRHPVFL